MISCAAMVIGRSRSEVQQEKWRQSSLYWKALPLRSNILFLAAVFCLFACLGFLASIFNMREASLPAAMVWALSGGCFAILYALSGTRRYIKLMIAAFVAQFGVNAFLPRFLERRYAPAIRFAIDDRLHRILVTEAVFSLVLLLLGYIFFIAFAGGEGKRVYGALTELRLANEIHRTLVPRIDRKLARFEIAAISIPSGEMGGDLVDVAENHPCWFAYLADVSGHGVSAGIVMSMVKSAVRMAVQSNQPVELSNLLSSLNSVLTPLSSSSTFVTFAAVAANGDAQVNYALAGHLPVLHYRRSCNIVEENSVVNFPLGLFRDADFTCGQIGCETGDILALLTDGLTETENAKGEELGLGPLKETLGKNRDRPLDSIIQAMRERALAFGKQVDDQSVLLIRRTQ